MKIFKSLIIVIAGLIMLDAIKAQNTNTTPPPPPLPVTTATNAAEVAIAHIVAVEASRIETEKKLEAANQTNERLIKTLHRGQMGARAPLPNYLPSCLVFTELPGTNNWIVSISENFTNVHFVASRGTNVVLTTTIHITSE